MSHATTRLAVAQYLRRASTSEDERLINEPLARRSVLDLPEGQNLTHRCARHVHDQRSQSVLAVLVRCPNLCRLGAWSCSAIAMTETLVAACALGGLIGANYKKNAHYSLGRPHTQPDSLCIGLAQRMPVRALTIRAIGRTPRGLDRCYQCAGNCDDEALSRTSMPTVCMCSTRRANPAPAAARHLWSPPQPMACDLQAIKGAHGYIEQRSDQGYVHVGADHAVTTAQSSE